MREVKNPREAQQGRKLGVMRYVLLISIVLAVIVLGAFLLSYVFQLSPA